MKKLKSTKFSFLMLALLFLLAQTVFAMTGNSPVQGNYQVDQESEETALNTEDEITSNSNKSLNNDIDDINDNETPIQDARLSMGDKETRLIEPLLAPKEVSAPVAVKVNKAVVKYVNADTLNVREEADSGSKLVATINRNDKVTYYETIGQWARIITWRDKPGYILAKYLVNSEAEVKKVAEPVVKKVASAPSRSTSKNTEASKPATAEELSLAEKICNYAKTLQGVKYVYGGYSLNGFDCSGFTKYVFAHHEISVPRSSSQYWSFGTKVARSDIRSGDVVLFDTDGGTADVSHVGIYLGNGEFIHASTSKGKVIVMNLNSYRGKYMGARRVIK